MDAGRPVAALPSHPVEARRAQTRGPLDFQAPKFDMDELGAWGGGAVIWGAMTGLMTKQVTPALVSAGVVGASGVARLALRGIYPSDGHDATVAGLGVARGALMGAAVGACIAAGRGSSSAGAMLSMAAKGLGAGAAVGAAAGAVEAATNTYLM